MAVQHSLGAHAFTSARLLLLRGRRSVGAGAHPARPSRLPPHAPLPAWRASLPAARPHGAPARPRSLHTGHASRLAHRGPPIGSCGGGLNQGQGLGAPQQLGAGRLRVHCSVQWLGDTRIRAPLMLFASQARRSRSLVSDTPLFERRQRARNQHAGASGAGRGARRRRVPRRRGRERGRVAGAADL